MNKLIQTDTRTGYTYLPVERHHMLNWGGLAVCDYCNQNMMHGYLVFVLNSCICSRCLNEWLARATIYPEDLQFQHVNQDYWYEYHIRHGRIGKED